MDRALSEKLYEIGAIKFGEFTLKSGMLSPIYIDLRVIISYPALLKEIAAKMYEKSSACSFDCLCGVPYTALPLATVISVEHNIPMCMRRKEAKNYGTKKLIEGVFKKGERCLLIEDLVTSGTSCFETIEPLEAMGLEVKDIIVLLDREQSAEKRLKERGYQLHAVMTLSALMQHLLNAEQINTTTLAKVQTFITNNQVTTA